MPTSQLLSWDSLIPGETIGIYRWDVDADHLETFRHLVDPTSSVYTDGTAPSLAYDTLHATKRFIELPQGTVHAKEAVEFHGPADPQQPATVTVVIADKSVRRGRRNFTVEYRVSTGDAAVLTVYKSFVVPETVAAPDSESTPTFDFGLFPGPGSPAEEVPGVGLPEHGFTVDQTLIDGFGSATATDGPIHSDPAVATPLFGGTLLQGMYLFEMAAQAMMRFSSPAEWMSSGRMAAKIVGSSICGDRVSLTPTMHQIVSGSEPRVRCRIEARTDQGKTVFVAEADGPLSAVAFHQENAS